MGRTVRALVALVVAGMLALTGCAGQNPTTAATINGVTITEAQVDAVAQGLAKVIGSPDEAGAQQRVAATALITNEVGRQVASKLGITIAPDDVTATIAQYTDLTALAADPALATFINDFATALLVQQQAGDTDFATTAGSLDVVVNPRYGSWDPTLAQLSGDSGSLSSPAPTASPATQG